MAADTVNFSSALAALRVRKSGSSRDRAFCRDVLEFPHVDVGGGWLILGLPPSEAAFHPAEASGKHELYLMCEGIEKFASWMGEIGVPCTAVHEEPFGRFVDMTLPGGGSLGVYQPLHERP
ncbi:MAG: extradiol dioxygenase [Gammaproteobacteria bacterium]